MNTVSQKFLESKLITKEASKRLEDFEDQVKEASRLGMLKDMGTRLLANTAPVVLGSALGDVVYNYFSDRSRKESAKKNVGQIKSNMKSFFDATPDFNSHKDIAEQRYMELSSIAPTLSRSPVAMKQVLQKTLHKGVDIDTLHKLVNLERNSLGSHTPLDGSTYVGKFFKEVSNNTGRAVSHGINQYLDYKAQYDKAQADTENFRKAQNEGSSSPKQDPVNQKNTSSESRGTHTTPPLSSFQETEQPNLDLEMKKQIRQIRLLVHAAGEGDKFSKGSREFFKDDNVVLERLREPTFVRRLQDLAKGAHGDLARTVGLSEDFKNKFEKNSSILEINFDDFTKTASFGNALGMAYTLEKEAGLLNILKKFKSNILEAAPKVWKDVKAPVIALGIAGTVGAAAGAVEEAAEYKRTLNENKELKGSWDKVITNLKRSNDDQSSFSASIDYNDAKVQRGAKEVFSALAMLAPSVATNPVVASSFVNTVVANENQMTPELVKMITETQKNISASNEYRSPFAKSPLFNGFSAGFTAAGGNEAIKGTISRYVNPRNTENKNNKKIKKPVGI